MRHIIALTCVLLTACGEDPRYIVHDVPIFGNVVPSEAHYAESVDVLIDVIAEATDDSQESLLAHYRRLAFVEFHERPVEYLGGEYGGLYYHQAGIVMVWLQNPLCIGYSAWAHEMLHHYQDYWGVGTGHGQKWIWDPPDGLTAVLRRELQARTCLQQTGANDA